MEKDQCLKTTKYKTNKKQLLSVTLQMIERRNSSLSFKGEYYMFTNFRWTSIGSYTLV